VRLDVEQQINHSLYLRDVNNTRIYKGQNDLFTKKF
jgi:hypothetical protein